MSSQNQLQTLKGFRDFIGPDAQSRRWLIGKITEVFEKFGFEPLESPALEYESLLTGKYGAEADKLIYSFEDRGGRRVALRYDQTVPTARIVSQYRNQLTFPFRRYQIQPVWRADKPQKGRYREFFQCDVDIIGSTSLLSDAEIMATTYAVYENIGIPSLKLMTNDREQLIKAIKNNNVGEEMVFSTIQTIDKLDKIGKDGVIEELVSKGMIQQTAINILSQLNQSEPSEMLKKIISYAISLGIPKDNIVFKPTLARGLDYYTNMIFEGFIPEYQIGSIGGGGRYNKLIDNLVGIDIPAVGIGIGFDRTLEAAQELGKVPNFKTSTKVLVTVFSDELISASLELTKKLRDQNIAAECSTEAIGKIDRQLKYADKKGIPYVMIIGPEEAQKNVVQLKNMQTSEQKELNYDKALKILNS